MKVQIRGVAQAFWALALTAAAGAAQATIIVSTGNPGNTGTANVLFNSCSGNVVGPALTVSGCLNGAPTSIVEFTSDENLTVNGGQARIEAEDGLFSYLKVDLLGDTFFKLILNINVDRAGSVAFTSSPGGTSSPFALGNGQNFFSITGENFDWVSFTTSTASVASVDLVQDVRQVRLGVTPRPVPEPTALALLGLGLLGAGIARRRKAS